MKVFFSNMTIGFKLILRSIVKNIYFLVITLQDSGHFSPNWINL